MRNIHFVRYCFVYFIFLLYSVISFAQQNQPFKNLINIGTVSPEVASLGKFGNIPVSHSTGTANITINVYEINTGQIKLPISLDYHTSGIKVDEVSSSVGTGWSLTGMYTVYRNMLGIPDDMSGGYPNIPPLNTVTNGDAYAEYLYNIRDGVNDTEPDIFQYSIGGQSGKFIFRKGWVPLQIPFTNNSIVYSSNGFKITDPNGNTYLFEEKQRSLSSDVNKPVYYNSWRITKIISANSTDTLFFSYESSCNTSIEHIRNFSHSIGYYFSDCVAAGSLDTDNMSYETVTHYESYLKEIKWREGKVVFTNACDRTDNPGTRRLDKVEVFSNINGSYNLIKTVKLYQSYFFTNPDPFTAPDYKNYRLKLDSVAYLPTTGGSPQTYKMTYNISPMAPRESFGQDMWGYNNAKFGNRTLMPIQAQVYNGKVYRFGQADRSTDSQAILACTIQSIEYPTKGKTVFELEPHKYYTNLSKKEAKSIYTQSVGTINASSEVNFTVNNISSDFNYRVFISRFNYMDVSDRPRAILTDMTTNQMIFIASTQPTNATDQDYDTGFLTMTLIAGHTYKLTTNIYTTTNAAVRVTAEINWMETIPNTIEVKEGGGLRVKAVTNYDINGNFINKELYQYESDGVGIILTPQFYQNINFEKVLYSIGCGTSCQTYYQDGIYGISPGVNQPVVTTINLYPYYTLIFHANGVLPASQFSGSPIMYRNITKFDVDQNNNPNGKTVYKYSVYQDASTYASSGNTPVTDVKPELFPVAGFHLISFTLRNGLLESEEHFKSTSTGYVSLHKKENIFTGISDSESILKVKYKYIHTGCEVKNKVDNFYISEAALITGSILLSKNIITTVDDLGHTLKMEETYSYQDTKLMPYKKETVVSNGIVVTENMKYPADLSITDNIYEKMVNRNIISPVIEQQVSKNGNPLVLTKSVYTDWFNNSKLLLPSRVDEQIGSNPVESKAFFNRFDIYGNILEQQKADDIRIAYLWGYNSSHPIAEVKNASYQDLVDVLGQTVINQLSGASPGTDAQVRQLLASLRTDNRLKDAMVTTYTYKPLVGMTSATDANGITTFYEYDEFQRLKYIRLQDGAQDQVGKIIKEYQYHYKGQN